MNMACRTSRCFWLIHLGFLLVLAHQPPVFAQAHDPLELALSAFTDSFALRKEVLHHRGSESKTDNGLLFLVTWSISDASKSSCVGAVSFDGLAGSYRDRFDWGKDGMSHRELTADELGAVRDALAALPEEVIPTSLDDVVLLSYWNQNRWTHRVYDRKAPPAELSVLSRIAGFATVTVPTRASN